MRRRHGNLAYGFQRDDLTVTDAASPPAWRDRALHRQVWRLALPIVLSNMTVPMLGLVGTAVIGHLDAPVYLAAVAVGALIFTFLYWTFIFLRMGTGGLTAQAFGADDADEIRAALARPMLVAGSLAVLMLALQIPICASCVRHRRGGRGGRSAGARVLLHPHLGRARDARQLRAAGLVPRHAEFPRPAGPDGLRQRGQHRARPDLRRRPRDGRRRRRRGQRDCGICRAGTRPGDRRPDSHGDRRALGAGARPRPARVTPHGGDQPRHLRAHGAADRGVRLLHHAGRTARRAGPRCERRADELLHHLQPRGGQLRPRRRGDGGARAGGAFARRLRARGDRLRGLGAGRLGPRDRYLRRRRGGRSCAA